MNWLFDSMGLTTERKVFFGLMVVAGAALFTDQVILGPSDASADAIGLAAESVGDAEPMIAAQPPAKPAAAILIERIRAKTASDSGGTLGSVFSLTKMIAPPVSVVHTQDSMGDTPEQPSNESVRLIAPRAVDLPALSSVMPSTRGGGAVLGGELVRVGDVGSSGYRLVLVQARQVVVERDGVEYTIEMPTISGHD